MFFRRQEGEYRETDRVTRFKLIKSGKHWLRASTSQFGLFKVLRGGVDAAQVTTEMIEEQSANTLTGLDILKGIAAAGTVLGGAIATQTTVYANDALEKTVESNQTLANTDTVTLGTVKDQEGAQADSLSVSVSQSQSLSEEASKNASKHLSESESQSVSTSTSASVSASTSASESASTSASESASTSASKSASTSSSQSQTGATSELAKPAASETASNTETSVRKEDAANTTADAALSKVITESLASLQAVENRLSQITSTTSSLVDTTTTAAVATTVSAESNKKAQEDRKRLSKISATMGEYLAKSIGLPNTEAAVAKVNAAVTAIEEALKTPNADLTDVIKQATSAQNSIINAVLRANNGKRSHLNGKQMGTGVHLLARNPMFGSNAIGSQVENRANEESITYLVSGHSDVVKARVTNETNLTGIPTFNDKGKVTSILWTLTTNTKQTMDRTQNTQWFQIPKELNMPTEIVRTSYVRRVTGQPNQDFSRLPISTIEADKMMPAEYNGNNREGIEVITNMDKVSLNDGDQQFNLLKRTASYNTQGWGGDYKNIWENHVKDGIIWDNDPRTFYKHVDVGAQGRVNVMRFVTTVPDDVTNEQLKNMKFLYGEGTQATTFMVAAKHTNPLGLTTKQAYPFEALGSGTYIVNQVKAPYDTNAFNAAGLKWWYENNDTSKAYADPNQYLVSPGTQNYSGAKGPTGTVMTYRDQNANTVDAKQIGRTPGVFDYKIHREFPDRTNADTPVKFVVKPTAPEITTNFAEGVPTQDIQISGATPNKTVVLYKNGQEYKTATADASGNVTFSAVPLKTQDSFNAKVKIENQSSYRDNDNITKNYVESAYSNSIIARNIDNEAPRIASITVNKGATVEASNPRKVIVYREEAFDVDVNLTDNSERLNKIKVHTNAQKDAPATNFEVTSGTNVSENGTSITFTNKTGKLGQDHNATATNPYKVNIAGQVTKNKVVQANAASNTWNRYITAFDVADLNNNNGQNDAANPANIQIEYRAQKDKYTPTATAPTTVDLQANGRVTFNSPESYISNKDTLPTTGITPGARTTYTWKDAEPTNWTAGNQTRTVVVTYPDGSTDDVTVNFTVRDTIAPNLTVQGISLPTTEPTASAAPVFTVFRGANFNPMFQAWDNSGKLTKLTVENLPGGVSATNFTTQTGKTESAKYEARQFSGTVSDSQTLGTHIAKIHVSDGTNERTYFMKYRVADVVKKNVPSNNQISKNAGDKLGDAHNYLGTTGESNGQNQDDKFFPSGMDFTWMKDAITSTDADEVLPPGQYTRHAKAVFPNQAKDESSTTRTVFAVDKTQTVVFIAKPTKPVIDVAESGVVTVAPKSSETTVNNMSITYTPAGATATKTLTATKTNNVWRLNETPTGVSINSSNGQVTFADRVIKNETTIVSTTRTQDGYTSDQSQARLVTDTEKPVITAPSEQTITTGELVEIPVTAVDTGVGLADTDGIVLTNLPAGLRYEDGKIVGSPTTASSTPTVVTVTAKDKRGNIATQQIRLTVQTQAQKYTPTAKNNGKFYAVSEENVDSWTARDFIAGDIPTSATVTWETKPTTATVGDNKSATLKVTYTDGSSDTVNYTYQVYPKLTTYTRNGKTGEFHSFKGRNIIGGHSYFYVNTDVLGNNAQWSYSYKLNNKGDEITTPYGQPTFSQVWNVDNLAHETTYTVNGRYSNGRFGAVTADNPALTSSASFNYGNYDYTAKQVFETTVGDLETIRYIIDDPGNAVKNVDGTPVAPSDTSYVWRTGEKPDASTVSSPRISTHRVVMTLSKDSSEKQHSTEITVVLRVKPQAPVISQDTITEKGGLQDQSIKVDNIVGGATVTLTIAGQTIKKKAEDNASSVTFTPADLQAVYSANNGFLPAGDITVKQEVTRQDPSDSNKEKVLTSAVTTGTVTNETEAPVATDTVVEVKDKSGNWVAVPNTTDATGRKTHTFYAGDELRFTTTFTDNSGKIVNTQVRQGIYTAAPTTNVLDNSWGTANANNINAVTTATAGSPASVQQTGKIKDDLQWSSGQRVTRSIVAEDKVGNRSIGSTFILQQGKLADKYPGVNPEKFVVADANNLTTEEKARVLSDIKAANPQTDRQITSYTQASDGSVTIAYADGTSNTVQPNVKYGVEKVSNRFYAISDETLADLHPKEFVRGVGNKALPDNTQVTWKAGSEPTFDTRGDRTATLLVTHPDGTTDEIPYNYTVYPKVEVKSNNGVTGEFYAFKGTEGGGRDYVPNGRSSNWANNIGGTIDDYTNLYDPSVRDVFRSVRWFYRYQVNNEGDEIITPVGTENFGGIWNTTGSTGRSHKTSYTVSVIYPQSRFGAVSKENPNLASVVSFNYTVIDPVAKQEYVTTAGDKTPLADIIAKPGEALKNSDSTVAFPEGTTYSWADVLSDTELATPGVYTKNVRITLPQGSTTQPRNARTVPITIKVKPKTPQIADDQVTNTGGLPKGITVTDVSPGATVTLTLGSKTIPKEVPAGATSVTFGADELADSNGLLPTGTVTVKQSKVVTNPTTRQSETLESGTTTKTITKETEAPKVTVKVEVLDKSTNTWVEAPKTTDGKSKIYAGDQFRVTVTTTDNSGKVNVMPLEAIDQKIKS